MYGRFGKHLTRTGTRDAVIAQIAAGSTLMPGCLSYIIARDAADENALWVSEVWEREEDHRASLTIPAVRDAIARARPDITGFGEGVVTEPVSGVGRIAAAELPVVIACIERYFLAHATRSADTMRSAFLPSGHVEGVLNDAFTSWDLDTYCAMFEGTPAGNETYRTRTLDLVDITGNCAMARATLVHPPVMFTDYFVLLKRDGAWKIANKVFDRVTM